MIHFVRVLCVRGTDFSSMFARQLWNASFDYELLDVFIQHDLGENEDIRFRRRPNAKASITTRAADVHGRC